MNNTIRAGRISGDPAKGLCERICIEVPRVFDGCRESFDNQTFVLELTGISPQAVPPFTFVEATNYGEIVFENVSVVSLTNGLPTRTAMRIRARAPFASIEKSSCAFPSVPSCRTA